MNAFQSTPTYLQLLCSDNQIVLERLLQTIRYRGFAVVSMTANPVNSTQLLVSMQLKGQAKLTTLQKSLQAIIDVQQCYLSEDEAKLPSILELEHTTTFCSEQITQPSTQVAEGV